MTSTHPGIPEADASGATAQEAAPETGAERARELLAAAQEAPTEVTWSSSSRSHVYERPLAALRDAQVASGQAVLATRAEIAEVAEAVRDLTRTLDSVLGELCTRVDQVERTLDAGTSDLIGEVSEACTELAEINAALRKPEPRRRWWLRWGGGSR